MPSDNFFTATLVLYLGSQLPALIALVLAIVLVVVNWSKDRRRSTMGIAAFVLALLCTLVWPVVVAVSAWLYTQDQVTPGLVINGLSDFVFRALTGLAWLLIVLALFPGKTRPAR